MAQYKENTHVLVITNGSYELKQENKPLLIKLYWNEMFYITIPKEIEMVSYKQYISQVNSPGNPDSRLYSDCEIENSNKSDVPLLYFVSHSFLLIQVNSSSIVRSGMDFM